MTAQERRTMVYGGAILAMVLLIWPYFRIGDFKKSVVLHLMGRFPLFLLGDSRLHLDQVNFNLIDDFLAITLNPGFVAGAIIGRFLVKDWASTFKALIPVVIASAVIFIFGFIMSVTGGHGGGDMAGLWVMAPIATVVFWPFAWLGALAGWKLGEYYDLQKANPN